jgi:dihydrofolate reductase
MTVDGKPNSNTTARLPPHTSGSRLKTRITRTISPTSTTRTVAGGRPSEMMGGCSRLLLGRRTFEMFAPAWSTRTAAEDPGAPFMNESPKYVVGSALNVEWNNSTCVGRYSKEAIRELKDRTEGGLYVSGSGTLVRALLADGLVDELHLFVFPLTLGIGPRLFPDGQPPLKFSLRNQKPMRTACCTGPPDQLTNRRIGFRTSTPARTAKDQAEAGVTVGRQQEHPCLGAGKEQGWGGPAPAPLQGARDRDADGKKTSHARVHVAREPQRREHQTDRSANHGRQRRRARNSALRPTLASTQPVRVAVCSAGETGGRSSACSLTPRRSRCSITKCIGSQTTQA